MIKAKNLYAALSIVIAVLFLIPAGGCKKDDEPARETSYILKVQDVLGVTGTATFIETSITESTITLKLNGAPSGTHPAALYMNTVAEGGAIEIELNPVDASGTSTTSINYLTYNQLIAYDGFIKVLKSSSEPNVILAQGDIGGNVITDTNVTYTLENIGDFGVSGTTMFEKRENGNTLVTLNLAGTIAGEVYPATINLSSVATIGGGPVTKTLNSVNGTTGKSYTNIRELDAGMNISYDNWLVYNGYINIYQTAAEFDNIISQGNIGSNVD
ncbi:hypothetical protein [Mariniphaga sp.]|uniref:hypothetical protein n=1 Tax=Mariniphaga sp. TaxID=1954475 RepID=UPI0035628F48